jgi:hypothetical protein
MRPSWAIAALGLVLAACGGTAEPNRFSLRTPGAHTGAPLAAAPSATATPNATAVPEDGKPVTRAERLVIKGWSDSLRHGNVIAAAGFFSIPSQVSNDNTGWIPLNSKSDAEAFNRALPCGAKLIRTRRSVADFVVGVFELTERKGEGAGCGNGVGGTVAVAFLIRDEHILQWVRDDTAAVDPGAAPTPTPEPTTTAPPTFG